MTGVDVVNVVTLVDDSETVVSEVTNREKLVERLVDTRGTRFCDGAEEALTTLFAGCVEVKMTGGVSVADEETPPEVENGGALVTADGTARSGLEAALGVTVDGMVCTSPELEAVGLGKK